MLLVKSSSYVVGAGVGSSYPNAAAAAAIGAAVIVPQHAPEESGLQRMLWNLLGPRLRGCDPAADPLRLLRQGMERLAVRDADRLLAELLQQLVVEA